MQEQQRDMPGNKHGKTLTHTGHRRTNREEEKQKANKGLGRVHWKKNIYKDVL